MKKIWMRMMSMVLTATMILGMSVSVFATATDTAVDAVTSTETATEYTLADDEILEMEQAVENTPIEEQVEEPVSETEQKQEEQAEQTAPEATEEEVAGSVTVETETPEAAVPETESTEVQEDKNDDKVEIKKNDKPYLALGENLTPEQQATVLSLMGIDGNNLADYDVVYINNQEEHQYLGSYIDSSKIGTKSLSSIVIVEREKGNGINVSTHNISYCTVGMYKNALATAGIENADIIVAGPFPISGTAALVGVFKAYKEMTGEEIDEANIDAALNELVVTGAIKANGADSDEVEELIAYIKQAVVERDLSDEGDIREIIEEACKKFDLTLTEEEMTEVIKLMQKISELDLDVDKLLNAAQSIYDKISTAEGGFWAKIRELLQTLWQKIQELF